MNPSLFQFLGHLGNETLAPLFVTLENLHDIETTVFRTAAQVAEGGIFALQLSLPSSHHPHPSLDFITSTLNTYIFTRQPGFVPLALSPNATPVPLLADGGWADEWFILGYTPTLTFLLCARSVMRSSSKLSPTHYALIRTIDPTIVSAALSYLQNVTVSLGITLPTLPLPEYSLNFSLIETFYQRISSTLINPQGTYPQLGLITADYHYTVSISPDGQMGILSGQGTLLESVGYNAGQLSYDGWLRFIHPDDLETAKKHFRRLISGYEDKCELHFVTRDGRDVWVLNSAVPEWSEIEGRVVRLQGAARDITPSKEIEAQLRASERRFMALFENAPVMALTSEHHTDGPYITACNKTFLTTLGYDAAEVIGQPLANFYSPQSQRQLLEQLTLVSLNPPDLKILERELITKDGRVLLTLAHAIDLPAEAGRPADTQAMYVDITERKATEAQLQRANLELEQRVSERTASLEIANRVLNLKIDELERAQGTIRAGQERLEDFFDTTTDLVQVTNDRGQILYVNRAWQNALGYTWDDLRTLNVQSIIHPDDLIGFSETIQLGLQHKQRVFELGGRIVTKDGRVREYEGTVSYRMTEEGGHESQAVFRDVTARRYAEQRLREESDRYRMVVRGLPNTILLLVDQNLRHVFVEGDTTALLGLSREEIEGAPLGTFSAQIADAVRPYYLRGLAGETVSLTTNFGARTFEIQIQPMVEQDQIPFIMVVATNITEKVAIERERQLQEERYRLVAKSMPNTILLLFDHELYYRLVEGDTLKLVGLSRDLLEGKTIYEALPPEEVMVLEPRYRRVLIGESIEFNLEFRGRIFDIQMQPLYEEDTITLGMVVAVDITEKIATEQKRLESEARYRLVAENMPDSAVYLFDHDYRYLLASGPAMKAHPTLNHPVEGRTIWDVLPEEYIQILLPVYEATLEGEVNNFEMESEGRFYNVHSIPVRVNEQIIGGLLLTHDITDRKQTEESLRVAKEIAEEATRAKSTFLANMSHEIRTPLNAIVGATGLMLNTDLTNKQKEYANIVRVSSDSLLALVSDILDFSKIEADKLELEAQPFDLRSCIEETLDLLQPQAASKHLELIYTMEANVSEWIVGDKNRIRQILMNLLSNAVKFTPQGEVQVSVRTHYDTQQNHYLDIAVRDTGIGLTPDQDAVIFDAFTQADTSTTRRYGGTGLGLAICKRLAELMGGTIRVESSANVGSTFFVTLQLPPSNPHPLPFPTDEDSTLMGKRILIVVGNPTIRQFIAKQTRQWGMRPLVSALEQTALAFLRQPSPPFDIVLWDESVNNHADNPLFQVMRDRAEQHRIPVILLGTGYASSPEKALPHTAYLHKPFKPGRFHEVLIHLVAGVSLSTTGNRGNYLLDTTLAERFPLQILLAEDNLVNQRVTLAILERLGYQSKLVADGREALETVRRSSFDVILMDVQMPILSGVEATQLIRRMGERIQQPYIIALTANAMQGDREQYLAAGMDAYLSKPLDITALQTMLQKAAEQKQSRAARSTMDNRPKKIQPVLDRAVLEQLSRIVGDTLIEPITTVIDLFLEEAPHYVKGLQQAIAAPDLARTIEHAHSLKSSSAALGGMAFSSRCATIEAHAAAGRLMEASLAANHLTDEFQILAAALLAWRRDVLRNQ